MTISDINSEIRDLCDADSSSYTDAQLLRRVNEAYKDIVGMIIGLDGTWEFDDSNYTTHPIGTTDLVAAQQDYAIDTTFLAIERVEVLDDEGNYHLIHPIDKDSVPVALTEFYETDGFPQYYDKSGNSFFLYPAPAAADVTLAAGLKVYFQRTADVFTSAQVTTGTKEPGFVSTYHMVLCYMAAVPYCMSYKKDRVALYEKKADELKEKIRKFYGNREKDVRKVATMAPISFR